jgi:hypothetical protein
MEINLSNKILRAACIRVNDGAVGSQRNCSRDLIILKPTIGFLPNDR